MRKINNILISISIFTAFLFVAFTANSKPIKIKISHATNLSSAKGKTWEYFRKLAIKNWEIK